MQTTVLTKKNDRLDKICYGYYGSTANRQVEIVLDKNPGLEAYPILLPEGITIVLPDIPKPSVQIAKQIKLWQ